MLAIVILGLFPDLRPAFEIEGELVTIDMTTTIELVMFTVGVLIILVSRPDVSEVPGASVFKAGMVSAIALFGIAWLTATFIAAHEEFIVTTIGGWVNQAVWIFALAVFLVAALTTSQSTATRTIVPIGLAAGLAPGLGDRYVGRCPGWRLHDSPPTARRSRPPTSTSPGRPSWEPSCSITASSCRC